VHLQNHKALEVLFIARLSKKDRARAKKAFLVCNKSKPKEYSAFLFSPQPFPINHNHYNPAIDADAISWIK
jgi:hypothetical protein